MRAVLFHGKGDVRYHEDVEEPEVLSADTVALDIGFCGVCGSDLHAYLHGTDMAPTSQPNHYCQKIGPAILGHEFAGTITKTGENVHDFRAGDKVAVIGILSCGACDSCTRGLMNLCSNFGFYGYSGLSGGLSERAIVRAANLVKLPADMSLELGALVEPLSVTWHAMKQVNITSDSSVLILGGGPIGLSLLLCVQTLKPRRIIMSEPTAKRAQQARDFGVDHLLNPFEEDVAERVLALTGGVGVEVAFICTGAQSVFDTACSSLRTRGTICNIALWHEAASLEMNKWMHTERRLVNSCCYDKSDYEEVVANIAAGRLKPYDLITSRISLQDTPAQGLERLSKDRDSQIKILVHP